MGHKYYSIVGQEELLNNIKNQVYVIDNNHSKHKRKIIELTDGSGALMKQLFWNQHVVLSIIVKDDWLIDDYDLVICFFWVLKGLYCFNFV